MPHLGWEPHLTLGGSGLAPWNALAILVTLATCLRSFILATPLCRGLAEGAVSATLSRTSMVKAFRALRASGPEVHSALVVAARQELREGDLRARVTFRLEDGSLQAFTIPSYGPDGIEVGDSGLLTTRAGVYLDFDPQF